jgi:hypothetical protein
MDGPPLLELNALNKKQSQIPPSRTYYTTDGSRVGFHALGSWGTTTALSTQCPETEFDEIVGRIQERSLPYWADPAQTQADEINHHDGGRGFYFEDPNGHFLEVITRRMLKPGRQ